MREKLIELLAEHCSYKKQRCVGCDTGKHYHPECKTERFGKIADHLIANGVTIPVHCHECNHWKNEINGCTEDKRFCDIGFYMVHKDGYCSFGEKKTENK